MFGYFYRRLNCREDVEDLTILVLTHFIQNLGKVEINSHNAYLWRIAHNQLVNFYRDKSKTPIYVSIHDGESLEWLDTKLEKTRSQAFKRYVDSLFDCAKRNL